MNFLSIAFLWALPLAAAPIVLHLFDRRREVVIEWGAMQFLMGAATHRTSARRFKQWLLLLLRSLAIAAVIFALARPALVGSGFADSEPTETTLIVDNSLSMSLAWDGASQFEHAIAAAEETIASLKQTDRLRVITTAPVAQWDVAQGVRVGSMERERLQAALRELPASKAGGDLAAALLNTLQSDVDPTVVRRRIVVVTDGQQLDWSLEKSGAWDRIRQVFAAQEVSTELEIVTPRPLPDAVHNLGVSGITAGKLVLGVNQPVTISATIQNHGSTASEACQAHWQVTGVDGATSDIPIIDPDATYEAAWTHSFSATGVYSVSCRISAADQLASDNQASVIVQVVDSVPVLVVEDDPELTELQRDAYVLQLALGWLDGETLPEHSVYVPKLVDPDRLAGEPWEEYRAVVIPNLTSLDEETIRGLREFVESGGGLWLALGPRTDIELFNALLYADGDGLAPVPVVGIVDETSGTGPEAASEVSINPFGNSHPAALEFADVEQFDLETVTISRRFQFEQSTNGGQLAVLLGLSNGDPLAIEHQVGRGRVIVQAVPLHWRWSGLARSQSFVVLIRRWMDYLTEPAATRHNLLPGQPLELTVAGTQSRDATLMTPDGEAVELTGEVIGDGVEFYSSRTTIPGEYALEVGVAGDRVPFHVQRDSRESSVTRESQLPTELLSELRNLGSDLSGESTVRMQPQFALWPLLLLLVVAVVLGELWLSGRIARSRYRVLAIAEQDQSGWRGFAQPVASKRLQGHIMNADMRTFETVHAPERPFAGLKP